VSDTTSLLISAVEAANVDDVERLMLMGGDIHQNVGQWTPYKYASFLETVYAKKSSKGNNSHYKILSRKYKDMLATMERFKGN